WLPVATSEMWTVLSISPTGSYPLAEAIRIPEGDQSTSLIQSWCPVYVEISCPFRSQIWTVVSPPPEARACPSGAQATDDISFVCPEHFAFCVQVCVS